MWMWRNEEPKHKTIIREEAEVVAPLASVDILDIFETPNIYVTPSPRTSAQPMTKPNNGVAGLADCARARKAKKAAELAKPEIIDEDSPLIDLTVDEDTSEMCSICKSSLSN
jgi:hypothetical protein